MSKCPVEKGRTPPGEHGQRRKKSSEYGEQLREKQKLRKSYGMLEKQFRNYFKKAEQMQGRPGENLLRLLETRLDSVIVRLGFVTSPRAARQFVRHGHILINGRRVDYPGRQVRVGDIIEVRDRGTSRQRAAEAVEARLRDVPSWLQLNKNEFKAEVLRLPGREDIPIPIDISLVVGLYSKV